MCECKKMTNIRYGRPLGLHVHNYEIMRFTAKNPKKLILDFMKLSDMRFLSFPRQLSKLDSFCTVSPPNIEETGVRLCFLTFLHRVLLSDKIQIK